MSDNKCILCNTVEGETKLEKIYEDDKVTAVVHPRGAAVGHVFVFPNEHYQIFEQVPDYEVEHLFDVVNKISIAVFEALGVQGTNIILQNGLAAGQEIPHVCIHIIPRKEGDDLDFQWEPKRLTEEQISTVEEKLKNVASDIGSFEKEKKKKEVKVKKEKKKRLKAEKEKENYMIKQLERIP